MRYRDGSQVAMRRRWEVLRSIPEERETCGLHLMELARKKGSVHLLKT